MADRGFQGGFQGLRVLALESRRATEIAKLIRNQGGEPVVAPAMREVPLASNRQALGFAASLLRGELDLVVFLTGVGIRSLLAIVETEYQREEFLAALRRTKIVSRGPKPTSVLEELRVPIAVTAPEPCTWREVTGALDKVLGDRLNGLRVAVQEYGAPSPELIAALTARGAHVVSVPVYRWALPLDLAPLRGAVEALADGRVDIVMFLTAVQILHLWQVAQDMGRLEAMRGGLARTVVLSIGPSTSEELRRHGIDSDFEPSHPRMGLLVNEAARSAAKLIAGKRRPPNP